MGRTRVSFACCSWLTGDIVLAKFVVGCSSGWVLICAIEPNRPCRSFSEDAENCCVVQWKNLIYRRLDMPDVISILGYPRCILCPNFQCQFYGQRFNLIYERSDTVKCDHYTWMSNVYPLLELPMPMLCSNARPEQLRHQTHSQVVFQPLDRPRKRQRSGKNSGTDPKRQSHR